MTPLQNLYYAIGKLAYAMACADGEVQKAERQKFHDIVAEELKCEHCGFDFSLIMFQIMDKSKISSTEVYEQAMKQLRSNSNYLSPELKETFIRLIEKIAEAYPMVTREESDFMERFKADVALLTTAERY